MRVGYQQRYVVQTTTVTGGTGAEKLAFVKAILNTLIEMGAPLQAIPDSEHAEGDVYAGYAGFLPDGTMSFEGNGFPANYIQFSIENNNNFCCYVRGLDGYGENCFIVETKDFCGATDCLVTDIHAIKSGDSFFFGFSHPEAKSENDALRGCISYAITPMRRLSDPSVNVGWSMVYGPTYIDGAPPMYLKTLPYVSGLAYGYDVYNDDSVILSSILPEADTGKIPLIPFFSGINDIYYENVYLSTIPRDGNNEKAFETDRGVFLVGSALEPGLSRHYCNFAFDITEAVRSAE